MNIGWITMVLLALTACGGAVPVNIAGSAQPLGQLATATPTAEPTTTDNPAAGTIPRPPTRWTTHTYAWGDGVNVSIPVPGDWPPQQDGDKIEYWDPSNQLLVRVNRETGRTGDPYAVFRGQADKAPNQPESYPGYQEIAVRAATVGNPSVAGAEWEFTFLKSGVARHAIVFGFHPSGAGSSTWITIHFSAPEPYFAPNVDTIYRQHALRFTTSG